MQPPQTPSAPDEPLYEAFYGLKEQPFALTTDPRFLFMGDGHRRAYETLVMGLRRREGLLLLTGDTGMGKTTVCRAVLEALGPRTFSALILNPYMSDAEVLRVILRDFGLVTRDEIRGGSFAAADVPQLLDTLEGFLRSVVALESFAVVVIDEAQSLSSRVLDQIRVLGSYELDGKRLLQIVLVGQPDLLNTISSEPMRALNERITRRVVLGPLSAGDVAGYVQHRLTVAGGEDALTFAPESLALMAELTRRVPRRLNLLCDRTLEEGRIEGTTHVTPALVRRAHQSMAGIHAAPPPMPAPAARVVKEPAPPPPVSNDVEEVPLREPDPPADEADGTTDDDMLLTFGQAPVRSSRRGGALILFAILVLLVAGAAGIWAWTFANGDAEVPTLPEAPSHDVGAVPGPFPPPTEAEERFLMQELQRLNPSWRPGGGD